MESSTRKPGKAVYTIIDKEGSKSVWVRIGWAHVNHDGSYNLQLDALPVNGKLQVRDWVPRDDWAPRNARPEPSFGADAGL
jgi:hypothetical protein